MRAERAVQLIELFPAGGGDRDGDSEVFATLALAQLNGGGVKAGVEGVGNHRDGMHQTLNFEAHDFDREQRRVLNERLGAGYLRC